MARFDAKKIHLRTKDLFHQRWCKDHLTPLWKKWLLEKHFPIITLSFLMKKEQEREPYLPHTCPFLFFPSMHPLLLWIESFLREIDVKCPLVPLVYFSGPESSGKTHLLHTIARSYNTLGMKTMLSSTQSFMQHFTQALRHQTMEAFRATYRSCDVFLLDDVHILDKQRATQEELFHTCNHFQLANRPIFLAGREHLPEGIDLRILSRIEGGMSIPLRPSSDEEVRTIIDAKSSFLGLQFEPQTHFLFQENGKPSLRLFDSYLTKAYQKKARPTSYVHSRTTVEMESTSSEQSKRGPSSRVSNKNPTKNPTTILDLVAEYFQISRKDLIKTTKERSLTMPRAVAIYLCRSLLSLSLSTIAKLFHRHHSTIIDAMKKGPTMPSFQRHVVVLEKKWEEL